MRKEFEMPFKSEAQRRKFGELVHQGKMSQSEFDKWNKETGNRKLPERLKTKQLSRPEKQRPGRKHNTSITKSNTSLY